MSRDAIYRYARRALVWLVAVGVLTAGAGVLYFGTPHHASDASVASVEADPNVTVTEQGGTYTLEPSGRESTVGLVFYPGARVHPDAYVASLAPLASEANVTVVVPKLRLNLAVLEQGAASGYVTGSRVENWYVGGHSLGGAMACRYAAQNPEAVEGVVLYASYCDRDISETGLAALSVTGSADTVLDSDSYEENRENLPADTTVRTLPLNHTQFGSYRGQRGDEPSNLSYATAHDRLANVTVAWVRSQGDT
ncbi:alpha/beta fold hydrolase [Haloarcula salinisoli]|uniref:alpha/beta fold hydrolase n=1 Tax=Haloarcula salinisoli TaxID=2487746 RepID=UPI002E29D817|nr:alpha/beta fold hydrolase [Halomicroarcula salinisoli]